MGRTNVNDHEFPVKFRSPDLVAIDWIISFHAKIIRTFIKSRIPVKNNTRRLGLSTRGPFEGKKAWDRHVKPWRLGWCSRMTLFFSIRICVRYRRVELGYTAIRGVIGANVEWLVTCELNDDSSLYKGRVELVSTSVEHAIHVFMCRSWIRILTSSSHLLG